MNSTEIRMMTLFIRLEATAAASVRIVCLDVLSTIDNAKRITGRWTMSYIWRLNGILLQVSLQKLTVERSLRWSNLQPTTFMNNMIQPLRSSCCIIRGHMNFIIQTKRKRQSEIRCSGRMQIQARIQIRVFHEKNLGQAPSLNESVLSIETIYPNGEPKEAVSFKIVAKGGNDHFRTGYRKLYQLSVTVEENAFLATDTKKYVQPYIKPFC